MQLRVPRQVGGVIATKPFASSVLAFVTAAEIGCFDFVRQRLPVNSPIVVTRLGAQGPLVPGRSTRALFLGPLALSDIHHHSNATQYADSCLQGMSNRNGYGFTEPSASVRDMNLTTPQFFVANARRPLLGMKASVFRMSAR